LFLLQPAIGDAGAPATAAALLADALIAVCAPDADPAVALETARQLLDDTTRWSRRDGSLVCDAENSPRRVGGFPPDDLLLITRALGG
jgi:hypothetical protein